MCILAQFSSVTQSCPILCDPMNYSMPGLLVYHQLLESTQPMSIELVMPSKHLILCCPLLFLPSIFPSLGFFICKFFKIQHSKTKIMASSPINSRQIDGETMETVTDFIFLGPKITADSDCSHEIKRCLLF